MAGLGLAERAGFVVDGFQPADLFLLFELGADGLGGGVAEARPEPVFLGEAEEVIEESVAIPFLREEARDIVRDGFRDAAVEGGDDREAGGHGFQHAIGDALLVLVRGGLAGVEEGVAFVVEPAELRGSEEASEADAVGHPEFRAQLLQRCEERPFPGDRERRLWKAAAESGEGAQTHVEAFLFDEAAGLYEVPLTVVGEGAVGCRVVIHGDARAVDADFLRWAAEVDEAVAQGIRTGENEREEAEEVCQSGCVAGFVIAGHDIHAVERDDGGVGPALEEREEVDARVTEVDVEDVGVAPFQDAGEGSVFAAVDDRRFAADVFEPEAAEEIAADWRNGFDVIERVAVGAAAFFGHHEGFPSLQAGDLPVDVEHLRLEEGCAVAGDDGLAHGAVRRGGLARFRQERGQGDGAEGWGSSADRGEVEFHVAGTPLVASADEVAAVDGDEPDRCASAEIGIEGVVDEGGGGGFVGADAGAEHAGSGVVDGSEEALERAAG